MRKTEVLATDKDIMRYPKPAYKQADLYNDEHRRITALAEPEATLDLLDTMRWNIGENTYAQYKPYILNFASVCERFSRSPFDRDALMDWLYALAHPRLLYCAKLSNGALPDPKRHEPGLGRAAIEVAVAAISQFWATDDRHLPTSDAFFKKWLAGLYRRLAQQKDRKSAVMIDDLTAMVDMARTNSCSLVAARDAAILLVGWSAALRRSEIANLKWDALHNNGQNWFLRIEKSKTDQEAEGYDIPIYQASQRQFDPIRAWQEWIKLAGIVDGLAFRRITKQGTVGKSGLWPQSIGRIVTQYGMKPNLSAHSLRIGYVTENRRIGTPDDRTRGVSRHKSSQMIDAYTRYDDVHEGGPGSLL